MVLDGQVKRWRAGSAGISRLTAGAGQGLVAVIARLPMLSSLLLNGSMLAAACMSTPASHGILEVAEEQARPRSDAHDSTSSEARLPSAMAAIQNASAR
jgi:hypothetical protein